jgi:hypothetical protein
MQITCWHRLINDYIVPHLKQNKIVLVYLEKPHGFIYCFNIRQKLQRFNIVMVAWYLTQFQTDTRIGQLIKSFLVCRDFSFSVTITIITEDMINALTSSTRKANV